MYSHLLAITSNFPTPQEFPGLRQRYYTFGAHRKRQSYSTSFSTSVDEDGDLDKSTSAFDLICHLVQISQNGRDSNSLPAGFKRI